MLLEWGGGLKEHAPSSISSQNTVKTYFFDFLKVHNELGKVTKFWTSRPLFSWRNSHLKKGWADSAPPALIGLIRRKNCFKKAPKLLIIVYLTLL